MTAHERGATLPKANEAGDRRVVACAPADYSGPVSAGLVWVSPPRNTKSPAMNFVSRVYSINDFVEWNKQKRLELNPAFQCRAVWNDKAKSYLMDTIIRGKPIPKVFIRQKINVSTKTSVREVVDGQQRIRTILSFVHDGFTISKSQNTECGGILFSKLPEEMQAQILEYEVSTDILINLPDAEVLDIFGRLNSYAVILNEQEKINATYFGVFKILADNIGHKYANFYTTHGIVSSRQVMRMQEVNLTADLLIAMREGIKSKKQIRAFYGQYEKRYDDDPTEWTGKFDAVIDTILRIYPEGIKNTEFSRVHLFYSLFTAIAHSAYGLPGLETEPPTLRTNAEIKVARNGLDRISDVLNVEDFGELNRAEQQFVLDSRRATTDEIVRKRRTTFLLEIMGDEVAHQTPLTMKNDEN